MNALIMDPDALVRDKITQALGKLSKEINVKGCYCSLHAREIMKSESVDFLFLDLEKTDLDQLTDLFSPSCDIIGMAYNSTLAKKAYELSASDFLQKPLEETNLSASLSRLTARTQNRFFSGPAVVTKTRIALSEMNELLFAKLTDIIYCKAEGFYTCFFLANNKQILVSKNLRYYEDLLPPDQFFRSHKSFLINLHAVSKYIKKDGGYLIMENGHQIPVSVRRKEEFMRAVMNCEFFSVF